MLKLAVIGKDVSGSTSPSMHKFIAKHMGNSISYDAISVPVDEFEGKIDGLLSSYDGLNVTIPYKLSVVSRLKHVDGDARVFGAVNTIVTATRTGFNTDGSGFMLMLANNGVNVAHKKALLLGAGGAGRSVAKKLSDGGATVYVYDKRTENVQRLVCDFPEVVPLTCISSSDYDIAVNATGVGMHGSVGFSPVGEEILRSVKVAVDLIYVPEKSEFLRIAEALGKKIINGRAMLFYQAYYAECIYFGITPDDAQAKKLFEAYLKEV